MNSKKVIWHLSSNRWNSAITEYALSSVRSLKARGYATYISPLYGSPAAKRALDYGIQVFPFKSFGLSGALQFRKLYKDIKPDIIITYGGPETTLLYLIPKNINVKTIRFRGADRDFKNPRSSGVIRARLDAVITPSRYMTECFSKQTNLPVETIALGCDTEKYKLRNNNLNKTMNMLIVGRFDPVKGHARFFEITKKILDSWDIDLPKPVLHIVGEKANLTGEDLVKQGESAGLINGENFIITQKLMKNIEEIMSAAAIGVIPSLDSEVICRTAEEFLLCGIPVLVSGAGSLDELLFDGAGASYRGLSNEEAALFAKRLLISSFKESESVKMARSFKAKALFSLETMGENLDRFIERLGK